MLMDGAVRKCLGISVPDTAIEHGIVHSVVAFVLNGSLLGDPLHISTLSCEICITPVSLEYLAVTMGYPGFDNQVVIIETTLRLRVSSGIIYIRQKWIHQFTTHKM
jgi:hypothetical protein